MKNLELMSGQMAKHVTRKFISDALISAGLKDARIVEISPGNKPILSKSNFPALLYVDYFDTEGVKKNNEDRYGYKPKDLQAVDIALSLDPEMSVLENASVKAVTSSHVFEHLPNPIKHLKIVERILDERGIYVLIVPDKRACFDVFRHPTDIGEWVSSYHQNTEKPLFSQHFNSHSRAVFDSVGGIHKQHSHSVYSQRTQQSDFSFPIQQVLEDSLRDAAKQLASSFYGDCHCSVFTPPSLHLLLVETNLLGLTSFWPIQRSGVLGEEFVIILQKGAGDGMSGVEKKKIRFELCQEVFL